VFVQRRAASPVRLTLAEESGSLIDGAWWPRSSIIANELPGLVEALDSKLGSIDKIAVNWSSSERTVDLDDLGHKIRLPGDPPATQRLMTVIGSRRQATILVVPCNTTSSLAVLVLRAAASMTLPIGHVPNPLLETVGRILWRAQHQVSLANESQA